MEEGQEASLIRNYLSFTSELDFNVSGAFVGQPVLNSNHLHMGTDYDSGTLERKRPISMAVMDGELLKKEG